MLRSSLICRSGVGTRSTSSRAAFRFPRRGGMTDTALLFPSAARFCLFSCEDGSAQG